MAAPQLVVFPRRRRQKPFFNTKLFPQPNDPKLVDLAAEAHKQLKIAEMALTEYNKCVSRFWEYEYNQFRMVNEFSDGDQPMKSDWVWSMLQEGPLPNKSTEYFHDNPDDVWLSGRLLNDEIKEIRDQLGASSDWTCVYCKIPGTTEYGPDGRQWHVDHIYAVSRGGDNRPDNLVLSCATCNLQKSAKLLTDAMAAKADQ